MTTDLVTVEKADRTAMVRFDRGNHANSLSFAIMRELTAVAHELADDPDLCAVVLTGRVDNFCLGMDLTDEEVAKSGAPAYKTWKNEGTYRFELSEPYVAFQKQIEDPANHPFRTPSEKIELFCREWDELGIPELPPVPKYIETWESKNDPLAEKYPLQLITTHFKRRTLSQFDNIPWLRELQDQAVLMNVEDARARGVVDGDKVRVFNDRGETIIPAKVTQRVMPGVAILPEGAWYDPDDKGIDRGGCANILTRDEISPGGSFAYNTALVQIEKV